MSYSFIFFVIFYFDFSVIFSSDPHFLLWLSGGSCTQHWKAQIWVSKSCSGLVCTVSSTEPVHSESSSEVSWKIIPRIWKQAQRNRLDVLEGTHDRYCKADEEIVAVVLLVLFSSFCLLLDDTKCFNWTEGKCFVTFNQEERLG